MTQERLNELSQGIMFSIPAYIGLILYIPRKYENNDQLDIKTDGKTIRVGNLFFQSNIEEQVYKMLTVITAVALRHTDRAKELQGNKFLLKLWTIACNVVINEVLEDLNNDKVKAPIGIMSKDAFIQLYVNTDLKIPEIVEEYFKILADSTQKIEIPLVFLDSSMNEMLNPEEFEDSNEQLKDHGLESELADMDKDLQSMIWSQRIESALAGTSIGSSLCKLLHHVNRVKTPWRKVLSEFLLSRLRPEREPNWRRPSRRVLAGVTDIYEPARDRQRGIKKLGILIDLSGSCWTSKIFSAFVSHIDKILETTASEAIVVTFDSDVQNIIKIPLRGKLSDVIMSEQVELTGGGGTDFVPPVLEIVKHKPDVVVGFTDCYGPFPILPPKGIPFIWGTLPRSGKPPWGKFVEIDD